MQEESKRRRNIAVILTATDDSNKLDEAGEKAKTSHSDIIPIKLNDAVTVILQHCYYYALAGVYSACLLLNINTYRG